MQAEGMGMEKVDTCQRGPVFCGAKGPATESLLVSATKWDPDGAYIAEFLSVTDSINTISFEFQCIGTRSFELPL